MRGRLNITIVSPSSETETLGNSITALRWRNIISGLGHHVRVETPWNADADVLVALHARRSNPSIENFHDKHPDRPIIVALTGTDLYSDLPSDVTARRSLMLATRVVALQEQAPNALEDDVRTKLRVIYQSAVLPAETIPALRATPPPGGGEFQVCVLSHLRDVKDPLRAALASRLLPADSNIKITHAGRALDPLWERRAWEEEAANPRYRWIGDQSHAECLVLLARSRALVLSSEMEGGANVIAEAAVCEVPVLCSRISGNVGMLGHEYPAYFTLRDTSGLAELLSRVENDAAFRTQIRKHLESIQHRFAPEREKEAWRELIEEL